MLGKSEVRVSRSLKKKKKEKKEEEKEKKGNAVNRKVDNVSTGSLRQAVPVNTLHNSLVKAGHWRGDLQL